MIALLLTPAVWACATCSDPRDGAAFLGPTLMMSLLPLTMFAIIFAWLGWSVRQARARAAAQAPGQPPPPPLHDLRDSVALAPDAR